MKIDKNGKCVEIIVSSDIFPMSCITKTMSDFIDECYITIEEKSKEEISVRLIPHKKTDLKELGYEFNTRLVASFVESSQPEIPAYMGNIINKTIPNQIVPPAPKKGLRSFIVLTRECINDCLFCTEKPRIDWPDPTTEEVKEILTRDCKSFSHIVFSGGEPSLHRDICELIEHAKKLGYDVTLFSNGRLFSNPEFTEKIIKAGLDNILIPLHGYPLEIHDQITQRPGSFKQTILGINNLASHNSIRVSVKVIPNKINYKILPDLASFIVSLPHIHFIAMDMLCIAGNALKNKDIISTKLSNMMPYMEKALDIWIMAGKRINITSLPLCLINKKYWKYMSNSRIKKEVTVGFNKSKESSINYTGQVLTPVCENCLLREKCPGTWPPYFKTYGDGELKPVIGPPHST